jgi:hypothetical protein
MPAFSLFAILGVASLRLRLRNRCGLGLNRNPPFLDGHEAKTAMPPPLKPYSTLIDFITGREIPNIGAEENRQAVERFLVEQQGYDRQDIEVDVPIEIRPAGESYRSAVDLVVRLGGRRVLAVKCAAGSLVSCEREILAAARLLDSYQIPLAAASDGRTALVLDTLTGRKLDEGLAALPAKKELLTRWGELVFDPLPAERREREQLIFRTYDRENVNTLLRRRKDG